MRAALVCGIVTALGALGSVVACGKSYKRIAEPMSGSAAVLPSPVNAEEVPKSEHSAKTANDEACLAASSMGSVASSGKSQPSPNATSKPAPTWKAPPSPPPPAPTPTVTSTPKQW